MTRTPPAPPAGAPVAALALALSLALGACASTHPIPPLGAGPYVAEDGLVFGRVLAAAQEAGYLPRAIDEAHGRFELIARSDLRGQLYFRVQCTSDGWIVVLPDGPSISRDERGRFELTRHLAREYEALVAAIESRVAVTAR